MSNWTKEKIKSLGTVRVGTQGMKRQVPLRSYTTSGFENADISGGIADLYQNTPDAYAVGSVIWAPIAVIQSVEEPVPPQVGEYWTDEDGDLMKIVYVGQIRDKTRYGLICECENPEDAGFAWVNYEQLLECGYTPTTKHTRNEYVAVENLPE
jgi:hypothetical protein